MRVEVTRQFNKDISKLRDKKLLLALKAALQQIETATTLTEIHNLKKMEGATHHFRLRIGDYRMGIYFDKNTVFVSRFLHRKEMYRYFP
ncbi:MAG TPA: type II toxin-antitoxin system RelE/ParE family toxin [Bacteroidia bacterium]|jgi:mRNA interferase RelE/StbE|nr:type II toxin-antitoxin system RelE/ParE family toxin [Bacteroidia bacterium]